MRNIELVANDIQSSIGMQSVGSLRCGFLRVFRSIIVVLLGVEEIDKLFNDVRIMVFQIITPIFASSKSSSIAAARGFD